MIKSIINLESILRNIRANRFESIEEVNNEFELFKQSVEEYHTKALKVFKEVNTCTHENYKTPRWSLRKNIYNYYYHFEKECKLCGNVESLNIDEFDGKNFPVGFEGATKEFYNLDI